jgi:hypothetical protein
VQIFKSQLVIRRLILKNCRLTSTSGILIARAIKDGLPLHVLDVGNTTIDANANVFNSVVGAAFAGAIIASPTLQELGLQSTQLCTNIKGKRDVKFEAAICLMEAMRASKVITTHSDTVLSSVNNAQTMHAGHPEAVAGLQRLRQRRWPHHSQRHQREQVAAGV